MSRETVEQQMKDSKMIVTQITTGDFRSYSEAESAVCMLYVPDMTISRSGISHALGELRKHFEGEQKK